MSTLELAVSRAVSKYRVLEDALHAHHVWFIEVGGLRVQAECTVNETGIAFVANFPEICFINPPESVALVEQNSGELVIRRIREFIAPAEGSFSVRWEMAIEESTIAA